MGLNWGLNNIWIFGVRLIKKIENNDENTYDHHPQAANEGEEIQNVQLIDGKE